MTPLQKAREYQRNGMHPFAARCQAAQEAGLHVSEINRMAQRERKERKERSGVAVSTVPDNAWWNK